MSFMQWAIAQLSKLLPLDEEELKQIVTYTTTLPNDEASKHLANLLGNSPEALDFISAFNARRADTANVASVPGDAPQDTVKQRRSRDAELPVYAPPPHPPPQHSSNISQYRAHTNRVIQAASIRARDEQDMQNRLQNLQFQYRIYNSEIEPEHDTDYYCGCPICNYRRVKYRRYGVQSTWAKAVMYPGEKDYNDNYQTGFGFNNNPYRFRVMSPYGRFNTAWGPKVPRPDCHAASIHQTIQLNNTLNREAQAMIDAKEPTINIWEDKELSDLVSEMTITSDSGRNQPSERMTNEKRQSLSGSATDGRVEITRKPSKLASFRASLGIKTGEERAVAKQEKKIAGGNQLRNSILREEKGRWPDEQWRQIVAAYQEKVGMTRIIADLRARKPIQYFHMLQAGYFEPIPIAWAGAASNPLKFSIEASAGWRGITPMWRGYEDTAEERLYWVLNHREGSIGPRLKPDFISALNMAMARMASAVEPPPEYYSADDTCHVQHTSPGYSKQVMPAQFVAYDRPETSNDDTMILLDVSGSMEFDPVRPNYIQYLITGYSRSTQPKNKDVAKAIIRRFTDAMSNHDHNFQGYDLVTFSSHATHIGTINHNTLDAMWQRIRLGGGTRVMTGWQKIKDLHFQKHSESAIHHPIYGWQAGPETPMLRLLLLLDGEATDMDEFELDLLGLSWAHVTIFLIGVDGCPHHHRHANELQRISDVNHHVSFVDAQGNTPERFVTHELLKRHLGYEISISEFQQMEELPPYSVQ